VMKRGKKEKKWDNHFSGQMSPAELYIESLGEHAEPLKFYVTADTYVQKKRAIDEIKGLFDTNPMFYSKNKGSVFQYLEFFPDDKNLKEWSYIACGKKYI
ncbi:MAG TPA: hypothetical protein VN611_07480, partial [Patescibacteria group bacterium]|nr:hypothetical protein [Patescibacteria group bacterium]